MSPTYEQKPAAGRDWAKLTEDQKSRFLVAVKAFVNDLRAGGPPRPGLRISKMRGYDDIWEMTWAPDGRATFRYGEEVIKGEPHIVWRRIGGHDIFRQP